MKHLSVWLSTALLLALSQVGSLPAFATDDAQPTTEAKDQAPEAAPKPVPKEETAALSTEEIWTVTPQYAGTIYDKVNSLVRDNFYEPNVATTRWPKIADAHKNEILAATNLQTLSQAINKALAELATSHTQFVTANDETLFFLRHLFASVGESEAKKKAQPADFVGCITGGPDYAWNEVRYVLDGSPAFAAGVRRGDVILEVDGKPFRGYLSYRGTSGNPIVLSINRGGKTQTVTMTPRKQLFYDGYVDALTKSVRIEKTQVGNIGYVHSWCGGNGAHDALEEALSDRIADTRGLLLDLRDGYGASSLEDLDFFYRPPLAYPPFITKDRKGKIEVSKMYYDRPVVALINRGSRSGKEILAYSLKRTKRAVLVGDRTAGAVVGGRLFPIDDRCALFLAVIGGTVDREILEGKGVAADVVLPQPHTGPADPQLDKARAILINKIQAGSRHQ